MVLNLATLELTDIRNNILKTWCQPTFFPYVFYLGITETPPPHTHHKTCHLLQQQLASACQYLSQYRLFSYASFPHMTIYVAVI